MELPVQVDIVNRAWNALPDEVQGDCTEYKGVYAPYVPKGGETKYTEIFHTTIDGESVIIPTGRVVYIV